MRKLYELFLEDQLKSGRINEGEHSLLLLSNHRYEKFLLKYETNEKFKTKMDSLNMANLRNDNIEKILTLGDDTEIIYDSSEDDIDHFFDAFDF